VNEITKNDETRRSVVPASLVLEEEGKVQVRLEMPGVSREDLEIRAEGAELTVVGKRQDAVTHGTWLLRERRRGDFRKTFAVDASIDLEQVQAELANGILTLTLPMKEAAKPRQIAIR
jgi:HSP20 family protein